MLPGRCGYGSTGNSRTSVSLLLPVLPVAVEEQVLVVGSLVHLGLQPEREVGESELAVQAEAQEHLQEPGSAR